jgi:hypothetical protein
MPDAWENAHGLNWENPADAEPDPDGDTLNNRQEFLAGTDPHDGTSVLRIETISLLAGGGLDVLAFTARSNRTYALQGRAQLDQGGWTNVTAIPSATVERRVLVTNAVANSARFYRLATPGAP